jgi:hypothetical protein
LQRLSNFLNFDLEGVSYAQKYGLEPYVATAADVENTVSELAYNTYGGHGADPSRKVQKPTAGSRKPGQRRPDKTNAYYNYKTLKGFSDAVTSALKFIADEFGEGWYDDAQGVYKVRLETRLKAGFSRGYMERFWALLSLEGFSKYEEYIGLLGMKPVYRSAEQSFQNIKRLVARYAPKFKEVDRKIVDDVEHRMVRLLHIRRLNN